MAESLLTGIAGAQEQSPAGSTAVAPAPRRRPRLRWLPAAAPYLVSTSTLLVVYLLTLLPSTGNRVSIDTSKFGYLGEVLGTGHSPGYPLYTMLNALIVRVLPLGEIAWRANLLSALFSIGLSALTLKVLRELGVGRVVATAGAISAGLTLELWRSSVVAEVYTLNLLFITGVLATLLVFERTREPRWLVAALCLYAFSFSHHTSGVLLLPGLLLYVVGRRATFLFRPRYLVAMAAAAGAGIATYLYIYWRTAVGSLYVETGITDLTTFLDAVTGRKFSGKMFAVEYEDVIVKRLPILWERVYSQAGIVVLLAVVGLVVLARRRPLIAALLALWAVVELVFALGYRVFDWDVFLQPVYLMIIIWMIVGLATLVDSVRPTLGRASVTLALALPAALLVSNWSAANMSDDRTQDAVDAAIAALPDRSLVFTETHHVWHQFNYGLLLDGEMSRRQIYGVRGGIVSYVYDQPVYRIMQFCTLSRSESQWLLPELERSVISRVPRDLKPFVYSNDYAKKVAERGYALTYHGQGLWAVDCQRRFEAPHAPPWGLS